MNLLFVRILFVVSSMIIGYQTIEIKGSGLLGLLVGGLAALILIFLEVGLRKVSVTGLSSAMAIALLSFGLIRRVTSEILSTVVTVS